MKSVRQIGLCILTGLLTQWVGPRDATAGTIFRDIPLRQPGNDWTSPALGRAVWHADIIDTFGTYDDVVIESQAFSRSVGSALDDTYADELRVGFVPPFADVPNGTLEGAAALGHGQWMSSMHGEYVISEDGRVSRPTDIGTAVTCMPWRVTPNLGDDYLVEIGAIVATGESARVAFFGNPQVLGTDDGLLDGAVGQLVLDLTRNQNSDELEWTVSWEADGARPAITGTYEADVDAEIRMQLGWNEDDDTFDAWLSVDNVDTQLAQGNMGVGIDVFGVGFELTGSGSSVTHAVAAVPEPATNTLLLTILGTIGFWIRRR